MASDGTPAARSAREVPGPVAAAQRSAGQCADAGRWAKKLCTPFGLTNTTSRCASSASHAAAAASASGSISINGSASAGTPRARSAATHSSACGWGRVTSSSLALTSRVRPARASA
jgi:hypothetical protein